MKATKDRREREASREGEASKEAGNSDLRSFHLSHLLFQSYCKGEMIPFGVCRQMN